MDKRCPFKQIVVRAVGGEFIQSSDMLDGGWEVIERIKIKMPKTPWWCFWRRFNIEEEQHYHSAWVGKTHSFDGYKLYATCQCDYPGTIAIEFSIDGKNFDGEANTYYEVNDKCTFGGDIVSPYFRVVFIKKDEIKVKSNAKT